MLQREGARARARDRELKSCRSCCSSEPIAVRVEISGALIPPNANTSLICP